MLQLAMPVTVTVALLPVDKLLVQFDELVIEVTVTVVFPALDNAAAGTVKAPLPGAPDVNDNNAVNPVAELAPLKS